MSRKQTARCWYCGTHLKTGERTRDHVIPKAYGGRGNDRNLVIACADCNKRKGMLSLEAYRAEHNSGMAFWGEARGL